MARRRHSKVTNKRKVVKLAKQYCARRLRAAHFTPREASSECGRIVKRCVRARGGVKRCIQSETSDA